MNKTVKIVLIVALCLFGVGLLVFFGYSVFTGYKLADVGRANSDAVISEDGSYDIIEKEIKDGRQDIEIDVSFASVSVAPSTDGKIHLTYTEANNITFDFQEDFEKISLKQTNSSFSFFGTIANSAKVELLLPEEHAGDLDIDTASGYIKVKNISVTGDFEFDSASGSVTVEDCACKESDYATASGDIELLNLKTASIEAAAASGSINIENLKGELPAELATASGEIRIENAQFSELEAASKSGGIKLTEISAKSCFVENTSGICDLDGVDARRIRIGTISGGIYGTLAGAPGDYTISTKNISGSNSLLNLGGHGERSLTVTTTSGDIELDFAE